MIIPTEAREKLLVLAEGKTSAQFVTEIWRLRQQEHPILRGRKSRGQYPIVRAEELPINVTLLFRQRQSNG